MSILQRKGDVRDLSAIGRSELFRATNTGRYVLSQVLDLVHWQTLSHLVERYNAESRV